MSRICTTAFLLILFVLAAALSSCAKKTEQEIVSRWPDGTVQKVYHYERKGEVREKVAEESFYSSGQKEMYGRYRNGVRHGLWTYWFKNGRKWSESAFENGLRTGKSVVWLESGFKNYEGNYSKGRPHGTWTFYAPDGSRNKDVIFEHGEKVNEVVYGEQIPFNPDLPDSIRFLIH